MKGQTVLSLSVLRAPDSRRGARQRWIDLTVPDDVSKAAWASALRLAQLFRNPEESSVARTTSELLSAALTAAEVLLAVAEAVYAKDQDERPGSVEKLEDVVRTLGHQVPSGAQLSKPLEDISMAILAMKFGTSASPQVRREGLTVLSNAYRVGFLLSKRPQGEGAKSFRKWYLAPLRIPVLAGDPPVTDEVRSRSTERVAEVVSRVTPALDRLDALERGLGLLAENNDMTPALVETFMRSLNMPGEASVAAAEASLHRERGRMRAALGARNPSGSNRRIHANILGTRVSIDPTVGRTPVPDDWGGGGSDWPEGEAFGLPQSLLTRLAHHELDPFVVANLGSTPPSGEPSGLKPAGRTDLLRVRLTPISYRRGEVSYVENIAIGEYREKKQSEFVRSERTVFQSDTQEVETTTDLQDTSRVDLRREASRVVESDLRSEGSVTISSRGPTKITASGSLAYDRSVEDAARIAEEYSKETVERAIERTASTLVNEMRNTLIEERRRENEHRFERPGTEDEHVSAVYQYLEKVEQAEILCYGEREVYDLLVPEPAAVLWYLATTQHDPLPEFEDIVGDEISEIAEDLSNLESLRAKLIRAYGITDLPPRPERTKSAATGFSGTSGFSETKEIDIPEGYEAVEVHYTVTAERDGGHNPGGGISVGTASDTWSIASDTTKSHQGTFVLNPRVRGKLPVSMNVENINTYAMSVSVECELTEEAEDHWRHEVMTQVAGKYEQLKRESEDRRRQQEQDWVAETIQLPTGSSERLRDVMRQELQRAVIHLMANRPVDFHLIEDSQGIPTLDLAELKLAEPEIRLLQIAFEWEHLSWIIYPYFWGRRSDASWRRKVVHDGPDPDFADFLRAGAARVQVPVRPGFEERVRHFMTTGESYPAGELPTIGDPEYVGFLDEQMSEMGAPGEERPWPEDNPIRWTSVRPVSLTILRGAKEGLPRWDPTTGEELDPLASAPAEGGDSDGAGDS